MENIIRTMTKDELTNLSVDTVKGENLMKSKKIKNLNAREKFEIELQSHEAEATKKALPFARHVAREDFNQAIKSQVDEQLRLYGSIEKPEELKLPVIDWNRYSDVANFDILKEDQRADSNLTNKNPGLSVMVAYKVYKFKGYGQIYRVMEDGPSAITRAIKNRALLDKTITQELKEEDTNESKVKRK